MKPQDFDPTEFHRQYDDALRRAKSHVGTRAGLGTLFHRARAGGYAPPSRPSGANPVHTPGLFDLSQSVPNFHASGMPARNFAGPPVGQAYLWPLNALSLFTALGGGGKTSALIAIACHIAAGRPWNFASLKCLPVIMLSVEESQQELDRKFGATVEDWEDGDRQLAIANLRLISCVGKDARITRAEGRHIAATTVADEIIRIAKAFEAKLIILDHLQGFTSGDLNNSDTATVLASEANRIVKETGAAVVFAAHVSKGNSKATEVDSGFTVGSLAFENAARQVAGMIPLSPDKAKKFKIDAPKGEILEIILPKNSYGPAFQDALLRKVYVAAFHTVRMEPYVPSGALPTLSKEDLLRQVLLDYLKQNPGTTRNKLDQLTGRRVKGPFSKTTRQMMRETIDQLLAEGLIKLRGVSPSDRRKFRLPPQATQVLEVCEQLPKPAQSAAKVSPPHGDEDFLGELDMEIFQ